MIWCKDITKVIKKTQETLIIDDIDIVDIERILSKLRWENCKVFVSGNNLIDMKTSTEGWDQEAITEPAKEHWYGTKYIKGKKQDL